MKISVEFLYAIAPGASREIVEAVVANQAILTRNGISDPTDLSFFFGFAACETGGFTKLVENLFYTSTARLRQVWPSRFKTDAAAQAYVRQPEKLANFVYGGRYGNRPGTNDGWDYRGSGIGQTTFRANFEEVENETGVKCVSTPDMLRRMPEALEAAAVFWRKRNLSRFAQAMDYAGLTKAWQGGTGGLADRITFTKRAAEWMASVGNKIVAKPQWDQRDDWLRKGSKGPAVLAVQQKLQRAGYYVGGILDGNFGDGTDDAVRSFQKRNQLVSDGVVGEATMRALDKAQPANSNAGTGSPPSAGGNSPATSPSGLAGIIAALIKAFIGLFSGRGKNGKSG